MAVARSLPVLPVELLEAYHDVSLQLHHPVRASTCIRQFHRLAIMLKQEVMLLQKIRYKQKNQHKSSTWWRHVGGSQRVGLRLLEQLNKCLLPALPPVEWVAKITVATIYANLADIEYGVISDKQPSLTAQSLFRLTEGSLRILLLLDKVGQLVPIAIGICLIEYSPRRFHSIQSLLRRLFLRCACWLASTANITSSLGFQRCAANAQSGSIHASSDDAESLDSTTAQYMDLS